METMMVWKKGDPILVGNTFRAGHTPWNKGKKLPYIPHPAKRGQAAWNKGIKTKGTPSAKAIKKMRTYTCQQCGRQVERYPSQAVTFCSLSCRSIHNARYGPANNLWQGGLTALSIQIRHCYQGAAWRRAIFVRDHFTCQACGAVGGDLEADHIVPFAVLLRDFQIKTFDDALACPALWDVSNGRTLCLACHKKTPTYLRTNV